MSHAALDSELVQLKTWLTEFTRQYPQMPDHPQAVRVRNRIKEIDDAKKRDKRMAKKAKKAWGTILSTVEQNGASFGIPGAADVLRKLAENPSDSAALAQVGTHIAKLASKDPRLAQFASVGLPLLTNLFVDDDKEED